MQSQENRSENREKMSKEIDKIVDLEWSIYKQLNSQANKPKGDDYTLNTDCEMDGNYMFYQITSVVHGVGKIERVRIKIIADSKVTISDVLGYTLCDMHNALAYTYHTGELEHIREFLERSVIKVNICHTFIMCLDEKLPEK